MKFRKFNRKSLLLLAVVLSLVGATSIRVPLWGSNTAHAQAGYTLASWQGNYAYSQVFGDHESGALGLMVFDGNGSFNGTQTATNLTGPLDEETGLGTRFNLPPIPFEGTYTVNSDGSGTFTLPAEVVGVEIVFDIVITQAEVVGPLKLATEIHAMQRTPTPAGEFAGISAIKRLPD